MKDAVYGHQLFFGEQDNSKSHQNKNAFSKNCRYLSSYTRHPWLVQGLDVNRRSRSVSCVPHACNISSFNLFTAVFFFTFESLFCFYPCIGRCYLAQNVSEEKGIWCKTGAMKRLKGACTYKCGFEYGFYQDFVVNDIWECFKPPNKKKTHYKRNGYSHHGFWSFNWFVKSLAKYWYFICEFMSLQHCCHVNKGMQGKNGYICN